jgi:hypothetical protein
VIISGTHGSGKTYLAHIYANYLHIPDFYLINPSMADIKSVITECINATNDIVICIENLDSGVLQVSYPLLKFIEDCPNHIYVVITCLNIRQIPDTILSRCALININNPFPADLNAWAELRNPSAYGKLKNTKLWKCINNFADADMILQFSPEHIAYFNTIEELLKFTAPISTITWKLQNFEDKSPTPIKLVIRYIMSLVTSPHKIKSCIDCLDALDNNNMSQNAVITKFVLENKYVE